MLGSAREESGMFEVVMSDGLVMASLAEGVAEPLESFIKTVSRRSTGRLNVLWGILAAVFLISIMYLPKLFVEDCGDQACR